MEKYSDSYVDSMNDDFENCWDCGQFDNDTPNDETSKELEEAREKYQSITVHCPHLDDNLNPAAELLNQTCKCGNDGKCYKCDKFIGFYTEDGTVFSYASFEGFCNCK